MVGTLVFAGVVGVGTLSLGVFDPPAPQVAFEYAFTNDYQHDSLVIEHHSGEAVEGDRLIVLIAGAKPASANGVYRWDATPLDGDSDVEQGAAVRLNATTMGTGFTLNLDSARITIMWDDPDDDARVPLSQWAGPQEPGEPTVAPTPESEA